MARWSARWTVLLLAALALVAGCGGDTAGEAASPATQSAAVETTEVVEPTLESAGKAYLAAAAPANQGVARDHAALAEVDDLDAAAVIFGRHAENLRTFRNKLVRIDFPADVAPLAVDLAQSLGRAVGATENLAAAARSHQWTDSEDLLAEFRSSAAEYESSVAVLRAALDLPEAKS